MSVRLLKSKIKSLVESEQNYTFPEFIFKLRQCQGPTRRVAAEDMGISMSRLHNLELGKFASYPDEVALFCEYYKISRSMLARKAKEFVAEKIVKKSKLRRIIFKDLSEAKDAM